MICNVVSLCLSAAQIMCLCESGIHSLESHLHLGFFDYGKSVHTFHLKPLCQRSRRKQEC